MFDGNLTGDIVSIIFYMLFQIPGCWMMNRILAGERFSIVFRLLMGSVAGTLALQWCPVLFAFVFGFTIAAHIMGLCLWIFFCLVVCYMTRSVAEKKQHPYRTWNEWKRFIKENPGIILMVITFFYFAYCLMTHTIPVAGNGSLHTGQSTFGDMNMHLGFITSIAKQKNFPPDYSIYPGVRLAYPFLCDSISSSLYIWGASLRVAYIVPMLFAICQVMGGFYCLIKYWFGRSSTALIAWIMFFLNGGLGFVYFMDADSLVRNFTDFYYTPTSIGEMNFQWAQIIANMLIPQRATLFGWAVLFPLLAFFLCAVRRHSRLCFVIAGIFAGALPMLHTHSFLGFGLVCTMWLLFDIVEIKKNGVLLASLPVGLLFFSILQVVNKQGDMISNNGMLIMGIGVALLLITLMVALIQVIRHNQWKALLGTWGIFLGIIIVLALPQLVIWTFGQAGSEGFVRGHFNWSNAGDQYVWFYLKNIGLTFVLFLPGYFIAKKRDLQIASPLLLIWFIAELVVFQPNEYDNNKLLFVGFIFMCGLAANFLDNLFAKKWNRFIKIGVATALLFFGTISALLTLGREYISDYELYSKSYVELAKWVEKNTEPDDILLTATNHNNAVASLTGRNIVCGSGSFLYYHGVDYQQSEADVTEIYQNPANRDKLIKKHKIRYVVIGPTEMGSFSIPDLQDWVNQSNVVYNNEGVLVLAIQRSE